MQGTGRGLGRGVAGTLCGQWFWGQGRLPSSPGSAEDGLASGWFLRGEPQLAECCRAARLGQVLAPEGPFNHPACTVDIGTARKSWSVVPWAA